ncbi:hypothetical protein V9T40_004371 [Parthenolecanium corni]|uniref:Activator of basal transcription 1 n=1 Tax=Parthenolecanium corni TaxID=536013 RepID=A0AAN9Y8J6_9HEMI
MKTKDSKPVKNKKGIIYLSSLPKYLNVTKLRELMENFGEVGRIFLQPQNLPNNKKKPSKHFTEGWVEFEKKRVAKEVAAGLNGKQIECRKRSKYFDFIWSVKYLSKFKWVHLSERVAYERAVRKHRMRVEISQAKKEATDFSLKVSQSDRLKLKTEAENATQSTDDAALLPTQRKTEEEYLKSKKRKDTHEDNLDVLRTLFS